MRRAFTSTTTLGNVLLAGFSKVRSRADAVGNVILAAGAGGQLELFGEIITGSDDGEVVVAKLDGSGALLWSRVIGGAGDGAVDLSVGADGVFVAGLKFNAFLATVSLDGSAASAQQFLVPAGEGSFGLTQGVTAVAGGGVVVAGAFDPKVEFGCGAFDARSGPDIFGARLPRQH